MTPLIDVIFLLLTFFIYSLITMVRVDVLPVSLAGLVGGSASTASQIDAVTIDRTGSVFWNREAIDWVELDRRLDAFAARDDDPTLYLAAEAQGDADRLPVMLRLMERVQAAGVANIAVVGPARDTYADKTAVERLGDQTTNTERDPRQPGTRPAAEAP